MDATAVGTQIGGTLAGILNPVIGGTTETSVTTKPSASSSTTTIVIVCVIVAVVAVIGFLMFKKNKS